MLKLKTIKVSERKGIEMEEEPMPSAYAPSFHVDDKQIPEVKDLDVGKKYRFVVEVEMTSKEEREKGIDSRFDIVAYKYLPKKTLDNMTDKELEIEQAKGLSS